MDTTNQTKPARSVVILPGDVELYPRRTGDGDTVELVVVTEHGEEHPVTCLVRPALPTASARAA